MASRGREERKDGQGGNGLRYETVALFERRRTLIFRNEFAYVQVESRIAHTGGQQDKEGQGERGKGRTTE